MHRPTNWAKALILDYSPPADDGFLAKTSFGESWESCQSHSDNRPHTLTGLTLLEDDDLLTDFNDPTTHHGQREPSLSKGADSYGYTVDRMGAVYHRTLQSI
jgi:hypothetical protein